jgi:hypothetical protein
MDSVAGYIITLVITLLIAISVVIVAAIVSSGVGRLVHGHRASHDSAAGSRA